jgi:hypothetical protein
MGWRVMYNKRGRLEMQNFLAGGLEEKITFQKLSIDGKIFKIYI